MEPGRAELKASLYHRRKVWRQVGGAPRLETVCDLCGRLHPTDLHENLVTRGDSRGNSALQKIILESEVNLHLLCNPCNIRLAMIVECRNWLLSLNLYRYGLTATLDWLRGLPFAQDRTPYLALAQSVQADMDSASDADRWRSVLAVLEHHHTRPQPYSLEEVRLWQFRYSRVRPSSPAT